MKVEIPQEKLSKVVFPPHNYLEEMVYKEFGRKLWASIENILHHYIDNPIAGELTKEKLRAANIVGLIYEKEMFPPKLERFDDQCVTFTLQSNNLGIRQGDMLIQHNGHRMPVSEISVPYYEERFIYDDEIRQKYEENNV